ncbi:hypothetical protein NM688_g3645 [Phlebia brevispora]|uniref:Uncharacterized protein n=1 Tax=Phlebia brevispora TaxID=194682 RepID=A0ACC1T5B9_9APHY|nr:hypothetical protein NM688_g3645 [Phlebia brevispora]
MFLKATVLSAFVGLASAAALDVWIPQITQPKACFVWTVGSVQIVIWDTSAQPAEVTNPIGTIFLAKNGILDLDHPLASDFPLTQGWQNVTVPKVAPGDEYTIVLYGDSGNDSPVFRIIPDEFC